MVIADAAFVGLRLTLLWGSQYWSRQKIREFQSKRLVEVMRYAVTHVPYYRRLNIEPREIRSPADLARFPILDKQVLQAYGRELCADRFGERKLYESRTSGST